MSDYDERGRRIPDPDELRDAYLERKAKYQGCKCGGDMPGYCPGWRNCPLQALDTDEKG